MEASMPELTLFAGCNGAGKSTLIEHFGETFDNLINPDVFARSLNPENPRKADLSAGKLALKAIRECLDKEVNFAVETTLSSDFYLKRMREAKAKSYRVYFYYIGLQDVQMHIDRVRTRVIEGGHHIDSPDILRRYDASLKNLKEALSLSDYGVVMDNSDRMLKTLLVMENGVVTEQSLYRPYWLDQALQR
ncbi:zeta toxin family protein [Paenibacillus sp. JX-17]|uniref:UDP-N-acetylglucosamine kinase n=1 Tax=Paenibacillus lacisoli TaxID=3064525 RepID=A0ABT9CIJ6_9BACL|nr:zeta toxin family protein [Paenibacillus sp. JX-17]MDO7907496.1 zeta toxin family protein [Paenibacillus sp. JX-17]